MSRHPNDFRILIASTPKTGNTWLKLLFARLFQLRTPYLGPVFCQTAAEQLGKGWVTHQHFFPENALLGWAGANGVWLLTMLRHPADSLVSLYHYCCNYPALYQGDPEIAEALTEDAESRQASVSKEHHIVDGKLIRTLQDRVMADLNISISWVLSGQSEILRYEDLCSNPASILSRLTSIRSPVSIHEIERSIDSCHIDLLRKTYRADDRFFRRGVPGEWQTKLPGEIIRRFREEEPFPSQLAFLHYDMEGDSGASVQRIIPARDLPEAEDESTDKAVPFPPIVKRLLEEKDETGSEQWRQIRTTPGALVNWLNAPADDDPNDGSSCPPITNLAAFVYRQRPDLHAAFPDPFLRNRLSYAGWFLRHAAYEHQLDRKFLVPIALGWLNPSQAK